MNKKTIKKKIVLLGLKMVARTNCVWFAYEVTMTEELNKSTLFNELKNKYHRGA